jgi:Tol biopolymer transport system component
MSSIHWMPELAAALDRLFPPDDALRADWDDVVGRVGRRRELRLGRRRRARPLRLAIVVLLLFLLLTGVATATYLLVRGNGAILFGGRYGQLLVTRPHRPGLRTIAPCTAGGPTCAIAEPAWSPDGTRLAFVRGFNGGGGTERSHMFLYVVAADGGRVRRLASCGGCGEQWESRLGWSPDGRWIAFSRDAGPRGQESLWVVDAAGGKPHHLTDCHASCADVEPTWSPNGQLLAFQHIAPTRRASGLYSIRPDGSGLKRISNDAVGDPAWSPDGRRVAFDLRDSVAIANANGSHFRVLFAGPRGTGPSNPSWSPDGRKLVFFKTPGRPGHFRVEVWTMNADGSAKKRLYHSGCCVGMWAPPVWSPDGRLIAFSANSAGGTFVMNADGSGLRRLSPNVSDSVSWQPLTKGERK